MLILKSSNIVVLRQKKQNKTKTSLYHKHSNMTVIAAADFNWLVPPLPHTAQ